MAEIVMPRLSDTMEEGTILRWIKRDGEHVRRGEELVEIETDKAAMVYESDVEGVLQCVAGEGDTLAVGATIAHVSDAASPDGAGSAGSQTADEAQPGVATAEITQLPGAPPSAAEPSSPQTAAPAAETAKLPGVAIGAQGGKRVKASPVARRVARERGVDLHGVAGSGPGGRIVKADVEATAAGGPETAPPASGATAAAEPEAPEVPPATSATLAERVATAKGETTVVEFTRTQQTIARRMAESKATIPDFALQMEIDMEACVALRSELKRLSPEEAPTYNDMIVKACALALREHPRANGSYRDGKLQLHARVNVGVAVAVAADPASSDDATAAGETGSQRGSTTTPGKTGMADALLVPTIFDADLKALGEIARETRALAERVRAGTIAPPELGGGTFTVSNLGMYGVRSFTAIVNPPQAAILSVGSLAPRAVVLAGRDPGARAGGSGAGGPAVDDPQVQAAEIVARHTLTVTLACDHRILYGADAARFLARVRELLEEPAALTL